VGGNAQDGHGGDADATGAVRQFTTAAERGDGEAQNALGEALRTGSGVAARDSEAAEHWFRTAADDSQHEVAMNNLGLMCQAGEIPEADSAEAVAWFRKAAEHGLSAAEVNVARCYEHGLGVDADHNEAAYWYEQVSTRALSPLRGKNSL